jgi:hypothetical protein
LNFDLNKVREIFVYSLTKKIVVLACQYGRIECEFNATCTKQDECQCIFNCNDNGESVQDDTTGITYPNQCRLNQARCNSYYQQSLSKKGMLNKRLIKKVV